MDTHCTSEGDEWLLYDGGVVKDRTVKKIRVDGSVTTIEAKAFSFCHDLVEVDIAPSVTTIESNAFEFCESLEHITLPKELVSIGDNAFQFCTKLQYIEIPPSVKVLGCGVFHACHSLHRASLGSVETIGEEAFRESGLRQVEIPETVTSIQQKSFYLCDELKQVKMTRNVENIDKSAFRGCKVLEQIQMPEKAKLGSCVFYHCPEQLKKILLPQCSQNALRRKFKSNVIATMMTLRFKGKMAKNSDGIVENDAKSQRSTSMVVVAMKKNSSHHLESAGIGKQDEKMDSKPNQQQESQQSLEVYEEDAGRASTGWFDSLYLALRPSTIMSMLLGDEETIDGESADDIDTPPALDGWPFFEEDKILDDIEIENVVDLTSKDLERLNSGGIPTTDGSGEVDSCSEAEDDEEKFHSVRQFAYEELSLADPEEVAIQMAALEKEKEAIQSSIDALQSQLHEIKSFRSTDSDNTNTLDTTQALSRRQSKEDQKEISSVSTAAKYSAMLEDCKTLVESRRKLRNQLKNESKRFLKESLDLAQQEDNSDLESSGTSVKGRRGRRFLSLPWKRFAKFQQRNEQCSKSTTEKPRAFSLLRKKLLRRSS